MATGLRAQGTRNRSVRLSDDERGTFARRLARVERPVSCSDILDRTICGDMLKVAPLLPAGFVDLLFLDPPYNLNKQFNQTSFAAVPLEEYEQHLARWIAALIHTLKPTATVYICGDWRSSSAIHRVAGQHFVVHNRITWEREKGRGALSNWKNAAEDIWFCSVSPSYTFHVDRVKLKRRVMAPYTSESGAPKDWQEAADGRFRLTHPSNLWTDLTVPFWSMPENTSHPTQKPEKLLAKLLLASTDSGDVVLDPFLGSGTASVVARKLGRHFVGIEIDEEYCCIAEKRLAMAEESPEIQGYSGGVFWERNTFAHQRERRVGGAAAQSEKERMQNAEQHLLFQRLP
ncbi:MAG: site-specific DNA-methyltransferase [Myxococcota bacterium]